MKIYPEDWLFIIGVIILIAIGFLSALAGLIAK